MLSDYPLLERCVKAGDVVRLFPLLADWSKDDLRKTCDEITLYELEASKTIETSYKEMVFAPEVFLSSRASRSLDHAREMAHLDVMQKLLEIESVIQFYLREDAP